MSSFSHRRADPRSIQELQRRASTLYENCRNKEAAEAFLWIVELAESAGESATALDARFWAGAALHGGGRLRDASRVLRPALEARSLPDSDIRDIYRAVTRSALIAVEIPVELEQIEEEIALTERWLNSVPGCDWRSRLLVVRARLFLARGAYQEALAFSLDGFERAKEEPVNFDYSAHLRTLIQVCLRFGHAQLARSLLDQWHTLHSPSPMFKWSTLSSARSDLARHQGNAQEALDWAERAAHAAGRSEDHRTRFAAASALVRSRVCAADFEGARTPLAALLQLRKTEVGEDRYAIHLIRADYHLACARHLASLPLVDLQFGSAFECATGVPSRRAAMRRLGLARKAYARALSIGCGLDELLRCEVRQNEIADRQALLGETREAIRALPEGGADVRPARAPRTEAAPAASVAPEPETESPLRALEPVSLSETESGSVLHLSIYSPRSMRRHLQGVGCQLTRIVRDPRSLTRPGSLNRSTSRGARGEILLGEQAIGRVIYRRNATNAARVDVDLEISAVPEQAGIVENAEALDAAHIPPAQEPEPDGISPEERRARVARQLHHVLREYKRRECARVGLALGEHNQFEEALYCFEEILALEKSSKDVWNNRAHCLLKLGRADEAFHNCLEALRIDSGFPLAWCTMGEIQESRGELSDARESYQQALELLTEESDLYGYVIQRLGAISERY